MNADLYGDRFDLNHGKDLVISVAWTQISKLGMFRNNALYLTCDKKRYELFKKEGFSLIKYFSLWRVLTDRDLV